VADEKDKTQNAADSGSEAAKKAAKPKRAPRKPAAKKPAADAKGAGAKAAGPKAAETAGETAKPGKTPVAKPARRRAKPVAKPARRRAKPVADAKAVAAEIADTDSKTEAVAKAKPARKPAKAAKPAAAKAKPAKAAKKAPPVTADKPTRAAKPARKVKEQKPARVAVDRAPDERVAAVFDADGKQVEEIKLSVERFGLAPDINLLHLAVRAEQAARRRGSASTKTRGEISGSTAKLYRQKGTGRARAGSVKSPTRSGGGTAFGPKPRSYEMKLNRKAVRRALDMALSDRAEGGDIYVARGLDLKDPSTAIVNDLLIALDIAAPVLVVTDDEPVVAKSVRNLSYAETGEIGRLSVEQVLRNRSIVVTEKAFSVLTGASQ
jgi:large subunit ribosomal protein L4